MKNYFLLFLICIPFSLAITINEVYYNPPGTDNNKEFIEIYVNNSFNLSNYTIADDSSNDTLVLAKFVNSSYALIVEDGFDFSELNCSIYTVGSTIGNNLNNELDAVKLYDEHFTLLDQMSYSQEVEGNYSLNLYNNSWFFYEPSPCFPLIITEDNETNLNNSICDFSLNIIADKLLYEDETIKFKHEILPHKNVNFSIKYWVEDLYGNEIKKPYDTTNTNQKSFTPKEKGANVYKIISELNILSCNDSNILNNINSYVFIHKSPETFSCPLCSECPIKSCPSSNSCAPCSLPVAKILNLNLETKITILNLTVSDKVYVSFNVTKGNTNKRAIYLYAKNGRNYVTEKKTLYLEGKNLHKEFNEVLELKDLLKIPDEAIFLISGLGVSVNKTFSLLKEHRSNNSQETEKLDLKIKTITEKIETNIEPNKISSSVIYESDNVKRNKLIPYFFLGTSILLNLLLILKKL